MESRAQESRHTTLPESNGNIASSGGHARWLDIRLLIYILANMAWNG